MSKNNILKMIFNESLQEHIYQLDEVIKASLKSVKIFWRTQTLSIFKSKLTSTYLIYPSRESCNGHSLSQLIGFTISN